MTDEPRDELGEILRRALHAEATQVVPSPDGLERIRAGIEQRRQHRFGLAWLSTDRLTAAWSRPALAVAATIVVAALGISAPQTLDAITSVGGRGDGPSGGGGSRQIAATRHPAQNPPASPPRGQAQPGHPAPAPTGPATPVPTAPPQGNAACVPPGGEPAPEVNASTLPTPTPAPAPASCTTPEVPQEPNDPGNGGPTGTPPVDPGNGDPTTEDPPVQTTDPQTANPEAVPTP